MVDDHPPGLGLKEHVNPAMEDLTIVLNEFYGMLDQHPAGSEPVVQNSAETPCTSDCIVGRHGTFTGCIANKACGTIDCVVAVRVHKLGGDDRVQGSANPSHVIAVDGNSWSHLDNVANNRALHGLSLGRGNAFAEGRLGRHSFQEPLGREGTGFRSDQVGACEIDASRRHRLDVRKRVFIASRKQVVGRETRDPRGA